MLIYRKCATRTEFITLGADGRLSTRGSICWTLRGDGDAAAIRQKELETLRDGVKFAMKIKAGQRIEDLAFVNADQRQVVYPDDAIAQEFGAALGADADEQWVGYVLAPPLQLRPTRVTDDTMCFDNAFTLSPFRSELQVIPIAYTYLKESVATHHFVCARVLRPREPYLEMSIEPFEPGGKG